MIITHEEQLMLLDKYDGDGKVPFEKVVAFTDGMIAMMELVDKKLKAERETHA